MKPLYVQLKEVAAQMRAAGVSEFPDRLERIAEGLKLDAWALEALARHLDRPQLSSAEHAR